MLSKLRKDGDERRGHPILFLSRGKMKNFYKILSFIKTAG
jgi:hypothetical protein